MKRYFIKSHFSDWREVSKEKFEKYEEFLRKNIVTGNFDDVLKNHLKMEESTDETKE